MGEIGKESPRLEGNQGGEGITSCLEQSMAGGDVKSDMRG